MMKYALIANDGVVEMPVAVHGFEFRMFTRPNGIGNFPMELWSVWRRRDRLIGRYQIEPVNFTKRGVLHAADMLMCMYKDEMRTEYLRMIRSQKGDV